MDKGQFAESFLRRLAEESGKGGTIWRASFTPEYRNAKNLVRDLMLENGLLVREDPVGTLYGSLPGKSSGSRILTGSHLDTVPGGGLYDGTCGVVLPILALGELKREGYVPNRDISVIVMYEEEGSRYPSSYLSSRIITGRMLPAELEERDRNGISIRDAMRTEGYDPEQLDQAVLHDVDAFVELHIEQGPVLDSMGFDIGVVENIVGLYSYEITLIGKQNHAGTTPMNMRLDPVLAASEMITELSRFTRELSETAVITTGWIESRPRQANVIAEEVFFTLDFRDGDDRSLESIAAAIDNRLRCLREQGFETRLVKKCTERVCSLNRELAACIQAAADRLGFQSLRMNSGAGHDSQIIAECFPTAMIFLPSVGGVSHSPAEYTRAKDLANGIDILKEVFRSLTT